jgi:phytoene dehydrogenase-like protein
MIDMTIPSTLDDTLAPLGHHVATLFCQHFNPQLPGGRTWDAAKEEAADCVVNTVTEYAPNFRRSIIARQIISPVDLEREWGLLGGDIFHGSQNLDQIFSLRPAAGFSDYRTPVGGLYLGGSGSHPGGGVSGVPGRNAALEMIKDFRRRRF